MWHREKDFLSKELYQLHKVKMQQVLEEIEQDEANKFDQQFYGELAYRNWLQEKGALKEKEEDKKNEKKENIKREPKDSLYKANSVRRISKGRPSPVPDMTSRPCTGNQRKSEGLINNSTGIRVQLKLQARDLGPSGDEGLQDKQRDIQTTDKGQNVPGNLAKPVQHEHPWNISNHTPPYEYLQKLPDYYPRDEYTMQPKYPLKKGGRPVPHTNMIPIRHEKINLGKKFRKPKLPPEMLEKLLMEGDSLKDRPVVFKCKNIMDVQKLKHYDGESLPKPEVAIHLCDDLNSTLFQAALQHPVSNISVSSTSLRSNGSTASSEKLSANFSELSLAKGIES